MAPAVCALVRWPDVLLLLGAGLVTLSGLAMLVQELSAFDEAAEAFSRSQQVPPLDLAHRGLWRAAMPALSVAVSILGAYTLVRVNRKRRVRSVARRPGLVLLAGLTLVDVALFVDWAYALEAHYLVRALTTPWLYALSGALVGGAAYQLAVLEDTLDPLTVQRS